MQLFKCYLTGVIYFAVLISGVIAKPIGSRTVQPATYKSPSGEYSLFVDPSDRRGEGIANYRFDHKGQQIWSGRKPFTLQGVEVTDQGYIVGIAEEDFYHLVILDDRGNFVLHESYEQHRVHHSHSEPYAKQLLYSDKHDYVIFRMEGKETDCNNSQMGNQWLGESWKVYRLSTGELLHEFHPLEHHDDLTDRWNIVDAQIIKNTPLTLLHWYTNGLHYNKEERSGYFSVVGMDGKPFWSLELIGDYADVDMPQRYRAGLASSFFPENPAIIPNNISHQFHLRRFADDTLLTVSTKKNVDGTWDIIEENQSKFVSESDSSHDVIYDGDLKYLGELDLGQRQETDGPFGGIGRFTFDKAGRIHFSSNSLKSDWHLRAIDSNGEIILERPRESALSRETIWHDTPRIGDDNFIQLRQIKKNSREYDAWFINLNTGHEERFDAYPGGWSRSISRAKDGRFIVINYNDDVICFAKDGAILWKLDRQIESDNAILGTMPDSSVFMSDGRIAMLTWSTIKILSGTGELEETIELDKKPYRGLVADKGGGFLLCTRDDGNRPGTKDNERIIINRFSSKGKPTSQIIPRLADGRTITKFSYAVAPDGRVWISDSRRFLRLDSKGVVDHILGPKYDTDSLGELAGFTVDSLGRYCAASRSTGAIHVFEQDGSLSHKLVPDPTDFVLPLHHLAIHAAPDNSVFIRRSWTVSYVRFNPNGTRDKIVDFSPRLNGWAFLPQAGKRCGINRDRNLVLVDTNNQILHSLKKRPNGNWFDSAIIATSPDGEIVTLSRDEIDGNKSYTLDRFNSNGDSVDSITIPKPASGLSSVIHTGKQILLVCENEVVIVTLNDKSITRWHMSELSLERPRWKGFVISQTNELLLYNSKTQTVHRFQLPEH